MRRLNDLGFDVAELQVAPRTTASTSRCTPKVVDAGHHSRRLIRLTGLDVEENQARRLLNDLDSFRIKVGLGHADEEFAAHRWVTERFERVMSEVPHAMRGKLEPAQIFHEVLEHRWFMSERAGASVPFEDAISDYVLTILVQEARRAGGPGLAGRLTQRRHGRAALRAAPGGRRMSGEFLSLVVIAAIAAATPLIVGLLRIRVAEVVLLLFGGVLFGPSVLGWIEVDDSISLLSDLGLGMLFFVAGMELEPKAVRGLSGRLAATGWGVSLVLASAFAFVLTVTNVISDTFGIAIALTSTALGTLLPVLRDSRELTTPFGTMFMGAGAWGEFGPIIAISLLLGSESRFVAILTLGGLRPHRGHPCHPPDEAGQRARPRPPGGGPSHEFADGGAGDDAPAHRARSPSLAPSASTSCWAPSSPASSCVGWPRRRRSRA